MSFINVFSEISPLKKVLLHRPNLELNNLTPTNMHRLLFDDLPDLEAAVREHDFFADVLRRNGVEVLYIEDLMHTILINDAIREQFISDFLDDAGFILAGSGRDYIFDYLSSLDPKVLLDSTFAGLRKSDLPNYKPQSLNELLAINNELLIDPMPNLYFQRDVFTTIGTGVSLNSMMMGTRRRESIYPRYLFKYHDDFSNTKRYFDVATDPGNLEGGDILIFNSEIVGIGISQRTSPDAIVVLAERILKSNDGFKKVLAFSLPKKRAFMHLDTVFTMVNYDTFAIHQEPHQLFELFELSLDVEGNVQTLRLEGEFNDLLAKSFDVDRVKFIYCGAGHPIDAAREQWNDASNTLAISPGEIIVYDRNHVTNEILSKAGINLHVLPSSELSRGRGGPRCMSMPLYRE